MQTPTPEESEVWSATTYIICFHVVEIHQANRVKLQFGFPQYPQVVPRKLEDYHNITVQIIRKVSLSTKFQDEIAMWNHRRQLVSTEFPTIVTCDQIITIYVGIGDFLETLFVFRASLLGDPRAHIRSIPQNQSDYPPTPQPTTQNQTPPTPITSHIPTHLTNLRTLSNTHYPSMYPSFQNSSIRFGGYPESSYHGQ